MQVRSTTRFVHEKNEHVSLLGFDFNEDVGKLYVALRAQRLIADAESLLQKCDGRRPVCGPCERNIKTVDDCQYADSGPTRTQMLEEDVAFLQARVRELEGRGDDHNSLFHNPYVDSLQHERRTYSMPALPHQADDLGSAFIPYPSGSTSGLHLSPDTQSETNTY